MSEKKRVQLEGMIYACWLMDELVPESGHNCLEAEEQEPCFRLIRKQCPTRPLFPNTKQPKQCQAVNANAAIPCPWTPPRGGRNSGRKWCDVGMCPLQRAWFPVRAVGDVPAAIANRQCPSVIDKSFGRSKLSD